MNYHNGSILSITVSTSYVILSNAKDPEVKYKQPGFFPAANDGAGGRGVYPERSRRALSEWQLLVTNEARFRENFDSIKTKNDPIEVVFTFLYF
jgi:hypothetical protein